MRMTFKQTIIKGVFDREYVEECIKSDIIPRLKEYVKVGNIEGRVQDITIDYNHNKIIIWMIPREM